MIIVQGQRDGGLDDLHPAALEAAVGMWEDIRAMVVVVVAGLLGVASGVGFYLAQEVSTNLCYGPTTMRQMD